MAANSRQLVVAFILAISYWPVQSRAPLKAPTIISEIDLHHEQSYKLGEDVKLTCEADKESQPQYRWHRDGVQFNLTAPHILTLPDQGGSFIIKSPRDEDDGVYQCFVFNELGTAIAGKTTLKRAFIDPFPTVTEVIVHKPTVGDHLVLVCRPPRSYPTGHIYWGISRPNNNQPKAIDSSDRVALGYDGYLYIANVELSDRNDGHKYVCIVNNKIFGAHVQGQDQRVDPVESSGPPSYRSPRLLYSSPTSDIAIRGQNKKMKCIFGGYPTPQVTWSRIDDTDPAARRFTTTPDGHGTEIEIANVQFDDAGIYRCQATNRNGTTSPYIDIRLRVESAPFWRPSKPSDMSADEEDNVELDCTVDGRPKPTVAWFINGKSVAESSPDTRRTVDGNRMRIRNVTRTDAQVVQCMATNEYGSVLANIILTVSASAPGFTTTPSYIKIVEGQNAMLNCVAFGAPKPQVTWLVGERQEPVSGDQFVKHANGSLEIRRATLEDAAEYRCIASNKFGTEYVIGRLVVRSRTMIAPNPQPDIFANVAEHVRIPCDVTTDPDESDRLQVEWRKDGTAIDFSTVSHLYVDPDDWSLHINGSKVTDTAGFSCYADNDLDSATSGDTRVIVRGPPDPPRDVQIISCLTDYIELTWSAPADNNSPVIGYVVTKTDQTTNETETVDVTVMRVVVSARPWTTYTLSVTARNAIGSSEPAVGSADGRKAVCTTPESAPKRNPSGVCTRLERPRQLIIVWEPLPRHEHNGEGFGYKVGYRLLSGDGTLTTVAVSNPQSSELMVHNQELFQEYEIFVQSVNRIGEAPLLSGERKKGYSGEGKPLDAPTNLRLRSDTLNSTYAQFTWDPVDTSIERVRGFFRGYRIQYWRADNPRDVRKSDVILVDTVNTCPSMDEPPPKRIADSRRRRKRQHRPRSSQVVGDADNLWPYSKIHAGVLVLNQGSEGQLSNVVEFTTPEGVPGEVGSLSIADHGSSHLTIRWTPPVYPNGILLSYVIHYVVAPPSVGPRYTAVVPSTRTTHRLLDLELDTEYLVSVLAETSVGEGESMSVKGRTLKASDPDMPEIGYIEVGDDYANVSWRPSHNQPSVNPAGKFYVEYINAKDKESGQWNRSEPNQEALAAGDNWIKIANLTPGEQYYFRVVAVNGIDPDTKETRSDPPWIERIGPPVGTDGPWQAPLEDAVNQSQASAGWFIILMCIIVLLLIVLFIACIIQRSRGQQYPVYEKEKAWGHDPNAPDDQPFNEYMRNNEPSETGQGSLDSEEKPLESDTDSLGEYEDQDPTKFNEDGSFIGQYNRRNPSSPTAPAPAPQFNTFV